MGIPYINIESAIIAASKGSEIFEKKERRE